MLVLSSLVAHYEFFFFPFTKLIGYFFFNFENSHTTHIRNSLKNEARLSDIHFHTSVTWKAETEILKVPGLHGQHDVKLPTN